jgi:hypothetical protein
MPQPEPSSRVSAARANIRRAMKFCATPELAGLHSALDLLQISVSEMRAVEAELRAGPAGSGDGVRRETVLLKREIACLVRVVDGCAALYRGLSVQLGCESATYTAQGCAAKKPAAVTAYEMQA